MAITRGQVTLQEAGTISKRLQTVQRTDGGTSDAIHNEVHCLIDPSNANDTAICNIINANPGGSEYGIVTRPIPGNQVFHVDDNAGLLSIDDGGGLISIDDGAGSITVDAPVGTPVATRLSDGAAFLTTSGGRLSVDASGVAVPITDNSGSVTVDAPVATPVFVRLSDGAATLIGQKVSASSLPVVIASDQSSIPVDIRRGQTLKFASISAAGFGNNTLVAAGTNKIKVVSYVIVADGTVTAKFQSGAGGTDLTGAMSLVANSGIAVAATPGSWLFETTSATLLNMSLSGAIGVRGHISYIDEA